MTRRLVMTLLGLMALPASAREVLVLTTATQMNSLLNDPGLEIQNRGPASIFCEVSVNGSGLTTTTGREVKPGGIWFNKRPVGRNVYCISTSNQVTTAATNVSERAEYAFSDGSGLPVGTATASNAGTCTSVAATTTVLALNAARVSVTLIASPVNTDLVFFKEGATATTANMPLAPGQSFTIDGHKVYTGVIDAIANSGTQTVCVVEN